jgi:pimeloyl-ACP methyl ester carboxylesterase
MTSTILLRKAPLAVLAAVLLSISHVGGAQAQANAKPTVVFVHGAFADASGFGAVTDRLQDRGYTVLSPADPLRGLASDAAYVASVMSTIKGPVVLVGHSYGGAVISEAANGNGNVKALVYLNAFALDAVESSLDISQRFTGGKLAGALLPRPFPQADGSQGTDLYINPAAFRAVFAADIPARTAARMATAQRPSSLAALQEKSTEPAWKTLPSWYLIGRQDQAIDPAAERFMAKRAKAHAVEINSSHASYVSHPDDVTSLILPMPIEATVLNARISHSELCQTPIRMRPMAVVRPPSASGTLLPARAPRMPDTGPTNNIASADGSISTPAAVALSPKP